MESSHRAFNDLIRAAHPASWFFMGKYFHKMLTQTKFPSQIRIRLKLQK
jgi:hypothetical protein